MGMNLNNLINNQNKNVKSKMQKNKKRIKIHLK